MGCAHLFRSFSRRDRCQRGSRLSYIHSRYRLCKYCERSSIVTKAPRARPGKMGFFKKPTLRTRDDQRTSAAELTLRASILPLCLVTILFFLWACVYSEILAATSNNRPGLLVRPHRHSEQAFPGRTQHHSRSFFRSASCLLWSLPTRFAGPCKLAA